MKTKSSDTVYLWRTIEEIAQPNSGAIKIGPFGSQLKKEDLSERGYKVYGQENIIANDFSTGDRRVSEAKFASLRSCRLFPGDLVVTMMGTIGQCAIFPLDAEVGIMDSHLLRIQVNPKIADPKYAALVISAESIVGRQIARMSHGSIMSGLSSGIVRRLRLPLPSVPEQRRIGEILDTADATIQHTEALIAKLKQMKAGLLHDLLTRGLDEHGQLRDPVAHPEQFKDSPLGRIPREWAIKKLGDIGTFQNGLNKGKKDFGFGTKFINISDVYQPRLNVVGLGRMNATKTEIDTYRLEVGDIILDRSSVKLDGVGYPTLFEGANEPVIFCGFIIRFRSSGSDWNAQFICEQMRQDDFRARVFQVATKSANVNINQEQLAKLEVKMPALDEQHCIERAIDAHDTRIRTEEAYRDKLKQLKQGLMDDLLTGRVRVKLTRIEHENSL